MWSWYCSCDGDKGRGGGDYGDHCDDYDGVDGVDVDSGDSEGSDDAIAANGGILFIHLFVFLSIYFFVV
jgi:hypothetical protein